MDSTNAFSSMSRNENAPAVVSAVGSRSQTDIVAAEVALYLQHIKEKLSRFQAVLNGSEFDALLIAAGDYKRIFQDDMFYPFKANPYFREWAPLNKRTGSYLYVSQDSTQPRLYLLEAEDIWHSARQTLPAGFEQAFETMQYQTLEDIKHALTKEKIASGTIALIAEDNTLEFPVAAINPQALFNAIDFQRCAKTPYEQHCVRQANRLAAPAHHAAYQAFMAGGAELDIAASYFKASHCSENDMPYGVIAGVNEHAAVLHHFNLANQAVEPRSLLLDAGIEYLGYASDITRTYAFDKGSAFADMIRLVDSKQQELVAAGAVGKSPVELHELALRKMAEVLVQCKVLTISVEKALETDMVSLFMPHGLGHHLGCNVHDKGGQFSNAQGDSIKPPKQYPKLRHTAPMVANQVYTVEPGLYFIPSTLQACRQGEYSGNVNWATVEKMLPYGGIRIEDNIVLHTDGTLENMTRNAFEQYS